MGQLYTGFLEQGMWGWVDFQKKMIILKYVFPLNKLLHYCYNYCTIVIIMWQQIYSNPPFPLISSLLWLYICHFTKNWVILQQTHTCAHKHKLHTHHKYILSPHICIHAQYTYIHAYIYTLVHMQVYKQPLRHIKWAWTHTQFPVTYNWLTKVNTLLHNYYTLS